MNKLLIANWKMNPATREEAVKLARASDAPGVVICPPFPFLDAVKAATSLAELGAQNVFWEKQGAYTGEVSTAELAGVGARYVIVGHSERRRYLGETDEVVGRKVVAVVEAGLIPIVCVGETKEQRAAGAGKEAIRRELTAAVNGIREKDEATIILTYEPVWAISTERGAEADQPEDVARMIEFIKGTLVSLRFTPKSKLIYGGSVSAENAAEFLAVPGVEGALVGGASLHPDEFKKIISIASGS